MLVLNNFDSFFDNLLPLRPLFPFVQSVLPTVFDDSLSYLETLGKVVKALNDTESNVNTLEQAVRAFADDLALYENLTISPVEITFNTDTGRYSASTPYADIVSAINEGHTMVLHVVDGLHGAEYYTATMKIAEINGVNLLYWESPAYTVNDVTVFYEAFINENDIAGVTTRTITGSGSDAFIIHYDPVGVTADKTFAEIVAAIEAEKTVMLFADNFFISNARWTTSGNDDIGYEVVSVQFNAFNVVTTPSGKNLGCVTYAVDDTDTWSVTRNGFPNESRVNALIDVKLAQLEGFNNIIILDYVESTGAVTYWDGEQTVNATGQYILNHLIDLASPQLLVLRGVQNHGVGMDTINIYLPVEWGQTTGAWFIDFYRVYDGNVELVRIPYATNIVTKTTTPIGGGSVTDAVLYTQQSLTDVQKAQARDNIGADSRPLILNVTYSNGVYTVDKTAAEIRANMHNLLLTFGLNEGVTIDSYQIYGSPPKHYIVFSVADPDTTSVTYIEYTVTVYFAGCAPSEADDVPTVTRRVIQHNIGGGSMPDTTNASAGDYLKLDSNKNAVWDELPLFAPPIVDTATGDLARITDGADDYPLKSLVATINPVQSGSGDPSPSNVRPITGFTGCKVRQTGKNLFDASTFPTTTIQGVTCTNNGNGSFTINGTATIDLFFDLFRNQFAPTTGDVALPSATYRLTGIPATTPYEDKVYLYVLPGYSSDRGSGSTFTNAITGGSLCIKAGTTVDNLTIWPMIRLASDGDDTYEPYQGDTYNIAFPSEAGTVYGGTLDVTNGVLTVTKGFIPSYNGETLPGEWISSMDVYTQGATPTTGAQVCYDLASPITYQLDPVTIKTLLGANSIIANTGNVTVEYYADTKLYIQKMFSIVGNRTTVTPLTNKLAETKIENATEPEVPQEPEEPKDN